MLYVFPFKKHRANRSMYVFPDKKHRAISCMFCSIRTVRTETLHKSDSERRATRRNRAAIASPPRARPSHRSTHRHHADALTADAATFVSPLRSSVGRLAIAAVSPCRHSHAAAALVRRAARRRACPSCRTCGLSQRRML